MPELSGPKSQNWLCCAIQSTQKQIGNRRYLRGVCLQGIGIVLPLYLALLVTGNKPLVDQFIRTHAPLLWKFGIITLLFRILFEILFDCGRAFMEGFFGRPQAEMNTPSGDTV